MSHVPPLGSAAPGLRRAGGDVPVAGLAPVHSPLLPLDGAHLLLAVLLPLLPRDLDGVVLRHGRRRVACPAEETELQGAGGQPRGLGAAPGCGSGSQAASGPAPRAHSSALPPDVTAGARTLQRRCKPSHICVPARHGLAQHCKPWHGHAPAALQAPALPPRRCKPAFGAANPRTATRPPCKSSYTRAPALQTLAQPRSSTANPRSLLPGHCKPSFCPPHCFNPSHSRMQTPQALIPPPGHTALLRTPVQGGLCARAHPCWLLPARGAGPALPLALQSLLVRLGGLQPPAGPVIISGVAGGLAAPLEEAALGRK